MAEIGNTTVFSQTDASNTSGTVPTWSEGMAPSQVNDSARALQGAVTREWNWRNATLTSTGAANAYVLTYTVAPAALYNGQRFTFLTNFANTGSATLNINSLGAKTIKKIVAGVKTALASGDLASGALIEVAYNSGDDSFLLVNISGDSVLTGASNAFTGTNTFAGDSTFNNLVNITEDFRLSGDISPAQITADQNDYAPTGHATASVIRISTDQNDRNITGLEGGADGRVVLIINVGSFRFFLVHDDGASSTAANRFLTADNGYAQIPANGAAILIYDSTSSRWRVHVTATIRAPQSAMEAATSQAQYVTPGFQHNHPGHPKVWGKVTYSAGTPTLQVGYNITSITDTGVGDLLVTFNTDFSGVHYAFLATCETNDPTIDSGGDKPVAYIGAMTAGTAQIVFAVDDGLAPADTGIASVSFVGLGDQ